MNGFDLETNSFNIFHRNPTSAEFPFCSTCILTGICFARSDLIVYRRVEVIKPEKHINTAGSYVHP